MRYLTSIALAASAVVLLAGCPGPQKPPPKPVGTELQLPLQPPAGPESQPSTEVQPARTAKEEMVGSLTGSLERLEQRLAEYRGSGPGTEDLKQAEDLVAKVRAALTVAEAAPEEGEDLMLRVHAVNTALFNLDQFLTGKGH